MGKINVTAGKGISVVVTVAEGVEAGVGVSDGIPGVIFSVGELVMLVGDAVACPCAETAISFCPENTISNDRYSKIDNVFSVFIGLNIRDRVSYPLIIPNKASPH